MFGFEWRRAPVGHDTASWGPQEDRHTVLAVIHTAACAQHLLDVIRLVESDPRIKVAFTADSDLLDRGMERLVGDIGGVLVPWHRATTYDFGLAVATSLAAVRRVRAPSIVMPFGERIETAARRETGHRGLRCSTGAQRVIHRCGAGPTSIVLAHEAEMARLARRYPETLPVTTVAGDPTYDRLTASLPLRGFYRRVLGIGPRQKLVVVGASRLCRGQADLLARLPVELPPEEYQVMLLFPPDSGLPGMGLADCLRRGLSVLPPEGDWRAALVAADWIIDDGAVGPYGAITGVPVLLSGLHDADVAVDSALAELSSVAPRLSPYRPIAAQLREATVRHRPERHRAVLERITSEPGRFNRNMRSLMYRHLRLRQPLSIPTTDPVSPPFRID
jgi:hypothetical protein